jgi:hypothetical protein
LYDQGFTISGARNRLQELGQLDKPLASPSLSDDDQSAAPANWVSDSSGGDALNSSRLLSVRQELLEIRNLLAAPIEAV